MTDFINKVIEIILIFILLVLAPLTISYMINEMISERTALNEVSQFIDRVTDKQMITKSDVDDLYLALSATGGTYDITVKRYVPVAVPVSDVNGVTETTRATYIVADDADNLNSSTPIKLDVSDVVKVSVKEMTLSPAKRMLWNVLKLDTGKLEFSLAGSVR